MQQECSYRDVHLGNEEMKATTMDMNFGNISCCLVKLLKQSKNQKTY